MVRLTIVIVVVLLLSAAYVYDRRVKAQGRRVRGADEISEATRENKRDIRARDSQAANRLYDDVSWTDYHRRNEKK